MRWTARATSSKAIASCVGFLNNTPYLHNNY
jgi:hypothetical protein